ncbi:hypothetical protein VFPBJ_11440 [Purpureocillium lilacinum]|uniref:Uncharacterized protein n=1 Tax=Purpureocillium lilacinum TaxID=33203 RepID=A0A179FBQ2_PURLI|nr:hypothetical protein VFPBJ_11440 [Purpureocillium lilacinum]
MTEDVNRQVFGLSPGPHPGAIGAGLYNCLLSLANAGDRECVFDLRRFYSVDAVCAKAGQAYHVAVHFLFSDGEVREAVLGEFRHCLAVDAAVYQPDHWITPPTEKPDRKVMAPITFLFTSMCPLVGPMTYGEVQRAVEHYFGWCDQPRKSRPMWTVAERVTVELVPRLEVDAWLAFRKKVLDGCDSQELWRGSGFECRLPCHRREESRDSS